MDRFKSVMLSILKFLRTVLPIIYIVIYGISWIIYLVNSNIHGHSFDGAPKAFWNTIELISDVVFVNAIVFVASFSCFMLIKPLPKKYKVLQIFRKEAAIAWVKPYGEVIKYHHLRVMCHYEP